MIARRAQRMRMGLATRPDVAARLPQRTLGAFLAPEYAGLTVEQARALRLGTTPLELARLADGACDLTRAEAHRWLSEAPGFSPLAWICRAHRLPLLRSWLVVRWMLRVLASTAEREALYRERAFPGPAGDEGRGRFADRLDEIQEEDLVRGPRTGVVAAFEHAAERCGSAWLERHAHDWRVLAPVPGWRLLQGSRARAAQWLVTPAALVREGRDMGHCVGGYVSAVERGQCHILALDIRGARATVELGMDGSVRQFFGARDKRPPAICARYLNAMLRANELATVGEKWGRL